MPYKYRKLTPEERSALIEQRIKSGYPAHAPPHPFRGSGYYLITAANFEHAPIMQSSARRTEFESRLLAAIQSIQGEVFSWVILPNHYHILVDIDTLDLVSNALRLLHVGTAYEWNKADELTGQRKVWYKFTDRVIRDENHYFKTINYIHYNPIKHGYTSDLYTWPWSSFQMYYEDHGRDWMVEKWIRFKPGDEFGAGWDDD
jgi:putative transposase